MRRVISAGCLLLLAVIVHAGEDVYSVATFEAVPMSMGGAVTARLGGLESVFYNPATYTHKTPRLWESGLELTVYTNPPAAFAYGARALEGREPPGKPSYDAPLLFLRGINAAYKPFHIGAVFAEEELQPLDSKSDHLFNIDQIPDNRRLAGYATIVLSRQVRIGASVTGFFRERRMRQYGTSYGLYLVPSRLIQVGVFFCDVPDFHQDSTFTGGDPLSAGSNGESVSVRHPYAGLEDESVNIGFSLQPNRNSRILVDLRSVFIEDGSKQIEARIGAEGRIGDHLALRAGAIPNTREGDHVVTWGIGLVDLHRFGEQIGLYEAPGFLLNYALVYRFGDSGRDRAHFFTMSWELGN
ncbi:hypothetical protein GF324_08240 [bacterium]|nr:hypothetical protein [bacterium]